MRSLATSIHILRRVLAANDHLKLKRGFSTNHHDHAYGDDHEFFNYTSATWLFNRTARLKERYLKFDVPALEAVAVRATGARRVLEMSKLSEGRYSKSFSVKLDNDREVVAKLPNPVAGPSALVTASEAATMAFVHEKLDIPVPRVLEWSTRPGCSHDVAADFIVMDLAEGQQLGTVWHTLDEISQLDVIQSLVKIESRFDSHHLPGFGSLYFSNELEGICSNLGIPCNPIAIGGDGRFVLGPSVERWFWEGKLASMALDRGPWRTTVQYLCAAAEREHAWISKFAVPLTGSSPTYTLGPAEYPEEHLKTLEMYLKLAPYLPPMDPDLCISQIRHLDLHAWNTFVSPSVSVSGNTTYKITDIIDWQHCATKPVYLSWTSSSFIQHIGPPEWPAVIKAEMPELPENFNALSQEEQQAAQDKRQRDIFFLYWFLSTREINPRQYRALSAPFSRFRTIPTVYVDRTWDHIWSNDLYSLQEALLVVSQNWDEFVSDYVQENGGIVPPCPVQFSDDETKELKRLSREWDVTKKNLSKLMASMGIDREGFASHEDFEHAKCMNEELMKMLAEDGPPEEKEDQIRAWPFQDRIDLP